MAGTVTITEERLANVKKVTFDWLCDAAGAVSGTGGRTTYYYDGAILGICTVPDGGALAPDDNYNITLLDDNSIDVLNSGGLLRDTANTEWVVASLGYVVGSRLTLAIDSAGNANAGTLYVFIGQEGDPLTVYTDLANALYASGGVTSFPSAAVPANNVSLAEVLRSVWAGLMGTAAGENGIATFPAAAAAANDVSLAEVIRYIQESQIGSLANTGGTATLAGILGDPSNVSFATNLAKIGTITNSGGTATLGGVLGDVANSSVAARLALIQGYTIAMERAVEKSDGAVLAGSDDLFTIAGGPILVTELVGIVTTEIGGAANCHIDMVVTEPAGTVALSTDVAIDADAAGTSYTFTVATPGVLTPTTAGALDQVPRIAWLCPVGTIKAHCSAAQTGNIKWYLVYKPLSASSAVSAAA